MKGFTQTLEAIIATFIVLGFIIWVIPQSHEISVEPRTVSEHTQRALAYLEANGKLRIYAINGNITGLKTELDDILPRWVSNNVTITYMNSTFYPLNLTSQLNFTISNIDEAYIYLWLENTSNPNIYINDTLICSYSGNYINTSKECDILSNVVNGTNALKINSTVIGGTNKYEVRVWKSEGTYNLPANTTIQTISYFVVGENDIYRPTEIFVYTWE